MSAFLMAAATASAVTAGPAGAVELPPGPPLAAIPDQSYWGTNGRVTDISVVGSTAMVGGAFSYLGPSTGSEVVVDADGGRVQGDARMANGPVKAIVSDGAGGYYVGGSFTRLGGVSRRGLAHILPSGGVDRSFRADVNGEVRALSRVNGALVVGGKFSHVADTVVGNLTAVGSTGGVLPGWQGGANAAVDALAADPSGASVYVGGEFTGVAGSSRSRLARVSAAGGVDSFSGGTNGTVRSIAVSSDGSQAYVGGDFTGVTSVSGASSRSRLAAFTSAGSLTGWAPAADGPVASLAVAPGETVYAAGSFGTLAGAARRGLGAVTAAGTVTPFDARLSGCHTPHTTKSTYSAVPCSTQGSALLISAGALYVGGNFTSAAGADRHDAAAFNLADGALRSWNPAAGLPIRSMAPVDGGIALGGDFTSVNGVQRRNLAALDLGTGRVADGFRADTDGMVLSLEQLPGTGEMLVAGNYSTIGGTPRASLARVSTTTGAVNAGFAPKINNTVIGAEAAVGSVWIGGKFTKVNGQRRYRTAKLNVATGALDTAWSADTTGPSGALRSNGMVQGIAVTPDGSKVFVAGPFTTVRGTTVSGGIAALSGSSGSLLPNQIGGVQGCSNVGPWINRLYLSDDGQRLYGGDVCPDFIYQWNVATLSTPTNPTGLNWRTWCNGGMQGRLEFNGNFYYGSHGGNRGSGGECTITPGGPRQSQQRLMTFRAGDGYLTKWAPTFDTPMGVWSFGAFSGGLLVGGDFTSAGNRETVQQGLAFFPGTA